MEKPALIKNIPFSEPHLLVNLVDYEKGRVVSRTFAQNDAVSLTLFAFDQGEGLSTHAAPGDAMVQVLDGEVSLTIGGKEAATALKTRYAETDDEDLLAEISNALGQ
ncbi:MAG: cupin domain-containing protein, partial [Deltaproteobacteria bacterium]